MKINNSYIKTQLRRIFLYSDTRKNVVNRLKVRRGCYMCEICGKEMKQKDINVHHINELKFDGDWNNLINNMFCDESDLLGLCKSCHDILS